MFELTNKVVLITGATGGIGRAIAQQMKNAGATVVVTGRNAEKLSAFEFKWNENKTELTLAFEGIWGIERLYLHLKGDVSLYKNEEYEYGCKCISRNICGCIWDFHPVQRSNFKINKQ